MEGVTEGVEATDALIATVSLSNVQVAGEEDASGAGEHAATTENNAAATSDVQDAVMGEADANAEAAPTTTTAEAPANAEAAPAIVVSDLPPYPTDEERGPTYPSIQPLVALATCLGMT